MPFTAPTISALATQTIRMAFEDLEHTITPADSREFPRTTLQHVRKAALEIENQLAARQSLRNMRRLAPLFNGMEHYAKVVDILCNGTPYLTWIWAPITLILRVSSEYVEAFEHIITGYSKIAESLVRFEVLGDTFRSNLDFQYTIAIFYADILQFHKHAYKFVKRSGWRLMFLTSWGRFQGRFDNILEDMKRHGELVDKEANAYNINEARQMRQDIRAWREESLEQLDRLEKEKAAKQYKSIMSWLKADESDQLAIFDAISTEGIKFPGTCSWILTNLKIKSWLEKRPDHSMLWLQGTPGSGKSVLSTQIVTFMKAENMFVIHHFCIHSYASSTMYEQILRSLLLQLLRRDGEIVAHVYEDCILGKKSPSVQALERLLKTVFLNISHEPRQTEYIWIMIDGLDECEAQNQASVVNFLSRLASGTSSSGGMICKILISSRNSSAIANRLRGIQVVSLTEEKGCLDTAIRQYASQRLESLYDKLYQLDIQTNEIEEIELEITKKADGMFLYARLVLDYLSKNIFYSGEEMRMSVHELPDQLSEFYRKILSQILIQLDSRSIDRVRCIFGWIAFTKRPLKRMEFLSAITFSSGDPKVSHIAPQYILDVCGALLEERRDTTLSFIHVSVKDFLQSASSNLKVTEHQSLIEHTIATITCLLSGFDAFALSPVDQNRYIRVLKGLHGFHVYATEYWTEYLLSHAAGLGTADDELNLLVLAKDLAQKLDQMFEPTSSEESTSDATPLDNRLELLSPHPLLQNQVRIACKARSLNRLESGLYRESDMTSSSKSFPQVPDGISAMLSSYQEIVRFLLRQDHYPGVTAEELEFFKSQFRTSAYTCRLSSCPRTTVGFESEELLREHEVSHTRRIACTFPDCRYPPFVSVQALKNHVNKYHNPKPALKSIRREGHLLAKTTATRPKKRANSDASITNSVHAMNGTLGSTLDHLKLVPGHSPSGNPPNPNANPQHRQHMINPQRFQQQRIQRSHQQQSEAQAQLRAQAWAEQAALSAPPISVGPSSIPPRTSSAMPTLSAPIKILPQQQMKQPETLQENPNSQFGQPLDAQLFMQGNPRQPSPGNGLSMAELLQVMFSESTPEQRRLLAQMPPEMLNEVAKKWYDRKTTLSDGQQFSISDVVAAVGFDKTSLAGGDSPELNTALDINPRVSQSSSPGGYDTMSAKSQQAEMYQQWRIERMILDTINTQTENLSGWQATVSSYERMALILNIVGNLRLASQGQPNPSTLQRTIDIVIKFEKGIFEMFPNKEQYIQQIQRTLQQLL